MLEVLLCWWFIVPYPLQPPRGDMVKMMSWTWPGTTGHLVIEPSARTTEPLGGEHSATHWVKGSQRRRSEQVSLVSETLQSSNVHRPDTCPCLLLTNNNKRNMLNGSSAMTKNAKVECLQSQIYLTSLYPRLRVSPPCCASSSARLPALYLFSSSVNP